MSEQTNSKITSGHLERNAYLYVRQSTLRQVIENSESTKRQYGLKQRALSLGWRNEQICVIDNDLGESGASTERDGFKTLVSEVGMGHAGIVMGLEVSRLARNSTDWHRLLEICALTQTLILDEEGIYDPAHFNDRLLLGLKGTMSEAELHMIRARLLGGALNKAKRGELVCRLPVGFVLDANKKIVFDPNKRVQESIRLFFKTFRRLGTAHATVREFHNQNWKFPKKIFCGPAKGDVVFGPLTDSRAFQILKNPRYADTYAYGLRQKQFNGLSKHQMVKYVDQKNWKSFIKNAHNGYITWDEYKENTQRLMDNSTGKADSRRLAPREGPALLQGIVICGRCGRRMSVRYHNRRGKKLSPDYTCRGSNRKYEPKRCQSIPGHQVDELVARILLEKMTPAAIEVALSVQEELQTHIEEADRLRHKHVEQAEYEKELARRRYISVDPENRLVADELESEWNKKITEYKEAKESYERKRKDDLLVMTCELKQKIMALTDNFPMLWHSETTSDKDRKRMVRLLLEDVTLRKSDRVFIDVRFKGGANQRFEIPLPQSAWLEKKHSPKVVAEIDNLLESHTDGEIAAILNQKGFVSGTNKKFDSRRVSTIRKAYGLLSYRTRLRKRGLLEIGEICEKYGVKRWTVYKWRDSGRLKSYRYDDLGRYLYEPIDKKITVQPKEVQYV
jgi:DNA invertase Pin-like site-specific DNA recombinase